MHLLWHQQNYTFRTKDGAFTFNGHLHRSFLYDDAFFNVLVSMGGAGFCSRKLCGRMDLKVVEMRGSAFQYWSAFAVFTFLYRVIGPLVDAGLYRFKLCYSRHGEKEEENRD